jgi:GGDEF domain-containing protein
MIEIVFVLVAAVLAREVAKNIFEVDRTLDRLVFASFGGRTMKMDEATEEIKTELIRSRRYQRSLTVLVVEPDPTTLNKSMMASIEEIQHNIARRYAMGKISEVINATARRPDLVMHQSDQFVLLCPETTAESSNILVERIKTAVKAELGVSVAVGVASFPNDALTFEELVTKASTHLDGLEKPAMRVPLKDDLGNH